MITGALVVGLLVARELIRGETAAARVVPRLLLPVAFAFGVLLALRLLDLVVGRA